MNITGHRAGYIFSQKHSAFVQHIDSLGNLEVGVTTRTKYVPLFMVGESIRWH